MNGSAVATKEAWTAHQFQNGRLKALEAIIRNGDVCANPYSQDSAEWHGFEHEKAAHERVLDRLEHEADSIGV